MSELHHTKPSHDTASSQPTTEVRQTPQFRSRAEEQAFIEEQFAILQDKRARARAERVSQANQARQDVQQVFAGGSLRRETETMQNPPRIFRLHAQETDPATDVLAVQSIKDNTLISTEHENISSTPEASSPEIRESPYVDPYAKQSGVTVTGSEEASLQSETQIPTESNQNYRETEGAQRFIATFMQEVLAIESHKNGRTGEAIEELQRIRRGLERLRSSGDQPILNRDVALATSHGIEQAIGLVTGIQSVENAHEDLVLKAQGVISRIANQLRVEEQAEGAMTELRALSRLDSRGQTPEAADTTELLKRLSMLAGDIYRQSPSTIMDQMDRVISKLEDKLQPNMRDSAFMTALRSAREIVHHQ